MALIALMAAGLADLFDGVVARRLRTSAFEKEFGTQLDTVVDAVAFVAAPAVIALNAGVATLPFLAGLVFFVVAGVVRLAHFNTLSAQGTAQSTHHRGLPVTYTALLLPLLFLLQEPLPPESFAAILGLSMPAIGLLFVVDVRIRKPHGVFYIVLPALAVALTAYWLFKFLSGSS